MWCDCGIFCGVNFVCNVSPLHTCILTLHHPASSTSVINDRLARFRHAAGGSSQEELYALHALVVGHRAQVSRNESHLPLRPFLPSGLTGRRCRSGSLSPSLSPLSLLSSPPTRFSPSVRPRLTSRHTGRGSARSSSCSSRGPFDVVLPPSPRVAANQRTAANERTNPLVTPRPAQRGEVPIHAS